MQPRKPQIVPLFINETIIMKPLQEWFDEYGESHQNNTNKLIHWVCIPAIFYSIIALLASIPAPYFAAIVPDAILPIAHWGTVLVLVGLIFYLVHSFAMFLGILVYSAFCLLLVVWFNTLSMPLWQSSLLIFIVAWIGQFYGHKIEGKKPSFFKDVQFLLIGPAWLIGFIYKKMGIRY